MARLRGALDAIAGSIKYHPLSLLYRDDHQGNAKENSYSTMIISEMFIQLKSEVNARLRRGQAVLVSSRWERFEESNIVIPYYLKSKCKFLKN